MGFLHSGGVSLTSFSTVELGPRGGRGDPDGESDLFLYGQTRSKGVREIWVVGLTFTVTVGLGSRGSEERSR